MNAIEELISQVGCECTTADGLGMECDGSCLPARANAEYKMFLALVGITSEFVGDPDTAGGLAEAAAGFAEDAGAFAKSAGESAETALRVADRIRDPSEERYRIVESPRFLTVRDLEQQSRDGWAFISETPFRKSYHSQVKWRTVFVGGPKPKPASPPVERVLDPDMFP